MNTGLPYRKDVAETMCFLAGHGRDHPDRPSCPKNRHEADRIVRALEARRAARMSQLAPANPWRDLAHDLRTFAAHAPGCEYQPTYPDTADTTCSCGFDDVLDQYDRRSSE